MPQGGTCTTTADCCTGYQCIVPPGSLQGTCTLPQPPPGSDMAQPPVDLAGVDLAGADLSTPPDMAQPPPVCALYGQSCSTTTPCCANQGDCLSPSPASAACTAGETDCTCYSKIF